MRISDWSSDVCSSDLLHGLALQVVEARYRAGRAAVIGEPAIDIEGVLQVVLVGIVLALQELDIAHSAAVDGALDRKSGVKGKSVSVRVDLAGRRIIKKNSTWFPREQTISASRRQESERAD